MANPARQPPPATSARALPAGSSAGPAAGQAGTAGRADEVRSALQARAARDARLAGLLHAAAAGDASAFESFYDATFVYARTVARRLLRDNAEIEDLLADCYFEAWRSAARFDAARGSPVTWLLTLVRSRGLDALRSAAARPDRVSTAMPADESAAADVAATPAGADSDPAERLWRRQAGAELHAALASLTSPERWVLGLAYLRELSHAEIASCTGMPLGTVKSHALRAQNKLRALLGPTLGAAGGMRTLPATS